MTGSTLQRDIAIIGISCRFPGASNIQDFWDIIAQGKETITWFSEEELLKAGLDESVVKHPNFIPASGYVENADWFDAKFFGFTQNEAEITDPQFRIFLECAWEALEDAGCVPCNFKGNIGTFVGAGMSLYAAKDMKSYFSHNLLQNHKVIENLEHPQIILGNNREYLPTRVSYKLNLKGPSINIQTACSTSLVATHIACQSLQTGESDAALVGASAFHAPLKSGYIYKEGTFFASDGHCRVFDENSEGIVGGNGAGVIILKRLEDAIASRDNIYAIIKSSAINNDGNAKVSYTAPSFEGQVNVVKRAQSLAGISPESITYIEAHGTGTKMGDPIEVAALSEVFKDASTKKHYCALGSVKANIGHLDTAAGMASLIKTVLCLKNKKIPPQINFTKENPNLKLEGGPFYINQKLKEWNSPNIARTAGVSSFGAGGTNAHCIIQEYKERLDQSDQIPSYHILTLSAKSSKALDDLTSQFTNHFATEHSPNSLLNTCYTSNCGRQHYKYRRSFVAMSLEDMREQLATPSIELDLPHPAKIAFLFTGQGSQYVEMGKDLYTLNTFFRNQLDQCLDILENLLPKSPRDILFTPDEGHTLINNTYYAQPLLLALEYSLAKLWLSWGIQPRALMGHSLGEYVAACIANVMSIEDGLSLVATRAQLMASLPEGGTMISIAANEQIVSSRISKFDNVSIAAINGPQSVVISGEKQACLAIGDQFEEEGIDVRPLRVSHAFHSHLMEPILSQFRKAALNINFKNPDFPIVSNLTGNIMTNGDFNANYWVEHLRNTIEFEKGIRCLDRIGINTYLEIGPKPILVNLAKCCLDKNPRLWLQSMAYKQDSYKNLLCSVQKLYNAGASINWEQLNLPFKGTKCTIPTYPFQRERFYIEAPSLNPSSAPILSYKKVWQHSEKPMTTGEIPSKVILLIGESNEDNTTLKTHLEAQGHYVHLATPTLSSSLILHKETWDFDPTNKDHCLSLLQKITALSKGEKLSVVFTHSMRLEGLQQQNYLEVYQGLIKIAQAQLELDLLSNGSLIIITKNAIRTSSKDLRINPLQTTFGSFVRSLNTEMGETVSSIVDLENEKSPNDLTTLTHILSSTIPAETCVRNGDILIPKLDAHDISKVSPEWNAHPHGIYLVTGGLGAIGLGIAEWLSQNHAKHILLMGRNAPTAKAQIAIKRIRESGCNVHIIQADISQTAGVHKLQEVLHHYTYPLKGIFHAAGTLNDASLLSLTSDKLSSVMAPKIQGLLNLDALIHEHNIDFLILFSSIASFLGSRGQINYAMANGFLDGYAHYLQQSGIHAVSINWGPWGEKGMASQVEKTLKNYNLGRISKKQGCALLAKCLQPQTPTITSLIPLKEDTEQLSFSDPIDLAKWIWNSPNHTHRDNESNSDQKDKLWVREDVFLTLKKVVKDIIGSSTDTLNNDSIGFHDLGIDSIMALQLRERLSAIFKLSLSATLIYKYPTLSNLADFLYSELTHEKSQTETNLTSLSKQLENELSSLKT